jgi:hypothetical protein
MAAGFTPAAIFVLSGLPIVAGREGGYGRGPWSPSINKSRGSTEPRRVTVGLLQNVRRSCYFFFLAAFFLAAGFLAAFFLAIILYLLR